MPPWSQWRAEYLLHRGRALAQGRHRVAVRPLHHINTPKAAHEPDSKYSVSARHALRAILRECSYLPDAYAREYMSRYALSRFRTYSFKAWERRNDPDFDSRLREKHFEAQKGLNQLRRANDGESKVLLRVLLMTYGRVGKRRRDLLLPLLQKSKAGEGLDGDHMLAAQEITIKAGTDSHSTTGRSDARSPLPEDGIDSLARMQPSLYALVLSQSRSNVPDITRPNPRLLKPIIPEFNSRMQPLAQSRRRNITRTWYADLLNRILPPLPTEEWTRLRRFAQGAEIPQPSPTRRRPALADGKAPAELSALEMIIDRPRGLVQKRLLGNREGHNITPRFLQRLYVQVFSQCPLMQWDSGKKTWNITWGQSALYARNTGVESMNTAKPAHATPIEAPIHAPNVESVLRDPSRESVVR